jgi:hypothetical protein
VAVVVLETGKVHDPDWENVVGGFSIVMGIAVIIAGIAIGVGYADQKQCYDKAHSIEREWTWGYMGGCRVEVDGEFVPLDNLRYTVDSE